MAKPIQLIWKCIVDSKSMFHYKTRIIFKEIIEIYNYKPMNSGK